MKIDSIIGSGRLSVGTHTCEVLSSTPQMLLLSKPEGVHAHNWGDWTDAPVLPLGALVQVTIVPHGAVLYRPAGGFGFAEFSYGKFQRKLTTPHQSLKDAVAELGEQVPIADLVLKELSYNGNILFEAHSTEKSGTEPTGGSSFSTPHTRPADPVATTRTASTVRADRSRTLRRRNNRA